jgi:hypothetical protein
MLPYISAAKRLGVVLFASMLAICTSAFAQESTGRIDGTVVDVTGGSIPGARLVASAPVLPRDMETVSDGQGNFSFPVLPAGVYSLTVTKEGFTPVKQASIRVTLGSKITINPRLAVGQLTQTVEIVETAVSLDITSSQTSTNITAEAASTLPRSRNFNSLLAMAPGVRLEPKSGSAGVGGVSVDGASGSENIYVIDGVEVSNTLNGSLGGTFNIPFEFLREIQVKSGGFESEYGGATGGVVNLSTKSGTNDLHGEAFLQFTSSQLNPRPRGFWQGSPLNADAPDFFAAKEDNYRRTYPGFTLGGPILKNRLYFFQGYSPELVNTTRTIQYDSAAQTVAANRAIGTRVYNNQTIQHYALSRLDYSATSKLNINTSFLWSPSRNSGTLANADIRRAPPANDLSVTGGFSPVKAYTASATYSLSPSLVVSARYGYKYENNKASNYGLPGLAFYTYNTASAASKVPVPAAYAGSNGFSSSSNTLLTARDITTRHNVYLDATKQFSFHGQHSLKLGYAINRQANDVATDYTNGRFLINWGDTYNRGSVTNRTGTYGYYTWEDGVRLNSIVSGKNQGFYIQDGWRVTNRVTVNVGIRFENEFLPPYKAVSGGVKVSNPIVFGWGDKIAPRLGVAWDLFGDGKWKLSGGYASVFDVMKFNLARGSFGGEFWVTHVYELNDPNVTALGIKTPGALGKEILSYDNRTLAINSKGILEGDGSVDPNVKPYQQREYHANLDHQLTSQIIASVRYTHKQLVNTIDDIGILDKDDNEIYLIGNPGGGLTRDPKSIYANKTPNGKEFLVPQATRRYDGLEFSTRGRIGHLQLNAAYTYSRLWGNYAGLANSDENGRSNPNNDRSFDLPYYYFDSTGSQKNVYGRLATDRPHTLKLFLGYDLKSRYGTTFFGINQNAWSGTPLSTSVIYQSAPTYPFGRGDLGRTPVLTQTDFQVTHEFALGEKARLRLEANAINILNQATVTNRQQQLNRNGAITEGQLPVSAFFSGYKVSDFVNASNSVPIGNPGCAGAKPTSGVCTLGAKISPFYNRPTLYQAPREIRLGVRITF